MAFTHVDIEEHKTRRLILLFGVLLLVYIVSIQLLVRGIWSVVGFETKPPTSVYLYCFAFSILYGEIRSITATFWPAVLMHGIANSFGHPLVADYVTFAVGKEYLGSISTGLIFIVFVAFFGVAINRWQQIQNR